MLKSHFNRLAISGQSDTQKKLLKNHFLFRFWNTNVRLEHAIQLQFSCVRRANCVKGSGKRFQFKHKSKILIMNIKFLISGLFGRNYFHNLLILNIVMRIFLLVYFVFFWAFFCQIFQSITVCCMYS